MKNLLDEIKPIPMQTSNTSLSYLTRMADEEKQDFLSLVREDSEAFF